MAHETLNVDVVPMEGNQFLLADPTARWWEIPVHELWDEKGLTSQVCEARHTAAFVCIGEFFEETFPVEIHVHDGPPATPGDEWTHVVEVSLDAPSGALAIGDEPASIPLPWAGMVRVRVCFADLGGGEGTDDALRIRLELWPAQAAPHEVVRCGPGFAPEAPDLPADGRRRIVGIDAYQKALVDRGLVVVRSLSRDPEDPAAASLLMRDRDGSHWEYSTPPPRFHPLLTEISPGEARERYDLEDD